MWREPAEESADLYPGLVVHDGRVTGSITAGRTRLPLWAFVPWVAHRGWGNVEDGYPSAAEIGPDGLSSFLCDLLEMRGEFGRLLLVLANAHRTEYELEDQAWQLHIDEVHADERDGGVVCSCGVPRGVGGWWEDEDLKAPVVNQLRRCLALLTEETP